MMTINDLVSNYFDSYMPTSKMDEVVMNFWKDLFILHNKKFKLLFDCYIKYQTTLLSDFIRYYKLDKYLINYCELYKEEIDSYILKIEDKYGISSEEMVDVFKEPEKGYLVFDELSDKFINILIDTVLDIEDFRDYLAL